MRISPALLAEVERAYPQLRFEAGIDDCWDGDQTVRFGTESHDCHLLHELAHALLDHRSYRLDIDLLRCERAAWDYARTVLAPRHSVTIDDDDVQDALDTYRNWLHNRSLCPGCGNSGLQGSDRTYLCVICRTRWTANAAKTCALRRRKLAIAKH